MSCRSDDDQIYLQDRKKYIITAPFTMTIACIKRNQSLSYDGQVYLLKRKATVSASITMSGSRIKFNKTHLNIFVVNLPVNREVIHTTLHRTCIIVHKNAVINIIQNCHICYGDILHSTIKQCVFVMGRTIIIMFQFYTHSNIYVV